MRIKSYYAKTVQSAMDQARKEMGPDALLIHSRRTLPDAKALGEYEVVFGALLDQSAKAEPTNPFVASRATSTAKIATVGPETSALDEMRGQIRDLHRYLLNSRPAPAEKNAEPVRGDKSLLSFLCDEELEESAALELTKAVQSRELSSQSSIASPITRAALKAELQERLDFDSNIGGRGHGPSYVALVGPAGAGKTVNLAKIALQYGLDAGRPVRLVSLDTEKVGGCEQLEAYARILGAKFHRAMTLSDLDNIETDVQGRELVLIDTPGFSYADFEVAESFAKALSSCKDIDIHLTLPATMRTPDLISLATSFAQFNAKKLLFTRLDETACMGPLLSIALFSGYRLSLFSTGQQIPESLVPASADFIFANLGVGQKTAQQAA